eukprot:292289_1
MSVIFLSSIYRRNNCLVPICGVLRHHNKNAMYNHFNSDPRIDATKLVFSQTRKCTSKVYNGPSLILTPKRMNLFKIPHRKSSVSTTSSSKMAQVTEKIPMDFP